MLIIAEKGIAGGIYHAIHSFGKANNKYMKDYHKNEEYPYFQYRNENNLYG